MTQLLEISDFNRRIKKQNNRKKTKGRTKKIRAFNQPIKVTVKSLNRIASIAGIKLQFAKNIAEAAKFLEKGASVTPAVFRHIYMGTVTRLRKEGKI